MAYHLFSTGEVLTASNVNSYLMNQTVMVFASASARTTALSGVLTEGMISYRTDSHILEYYTGSAWTAVSSAGYSAPTLGSTSIPSGATVTTIAGLTLTSPVITSAINAQSGTSYTPVLSDNTSIITLSNASAIAVTIPPNSSVAYAVGTQLNFAQYGAGQVTISGGSGVTIVSTGATAATPKLRAQYASASAIQTSANNWLVVGDIS
jgi:hypothetical protein